MKIGVISEPHLGRRQFRKMSNDMNIIEREGYAQWFRSIDKIIELNPDILFITGDLFDSPNPTSIAITEAIKGYRKLEESDIAVYTIGGNHEYSIRNDNEGSHPFKILEGVFPDFNFVSSDYEIINLSKYDIVLLPHQPIGFKDNMEFDKNKFNKIHSEVAKSINKSDKKKILATHGVIESWAKLYTMKDDIDDSMRITNMVISDEFSQMFDYVVIGHNHQHFIEKIDNSRGGVSMRISPGSILDERSQRDNGPMILDLESSTVEYYGLSSINTYKKDIQNASELSKYLQNIDEHIYLITYSGNWDDVDSQLYEQASKRALYLNIADSKSEKQAPVRKIKDFWDWVRETDPELEQQFRNIIKEKKGV